MTGKELHNKLKTTTIRGEKIILKKLAERLSMSEPALQKRLKVGDVGIGFLMSICDALQVPMSHFIDCNYPFNTSSTTPPQQSVTEDLDYMKKELERLSKLIENKKG